MSTPNQPAWLCLPPLTMYLADLSITLLGQEVGYWQGVYAVVIEQNPIGYMLLAWHPLPFISIGMGWGIAFSLAIFFWQPRLTVSLAFLLTVGHAIGAASWLPHYGVPGWIGAVGVLVAARLLWAVAWKRSTS